MEKQVRPQQGNTFMAWLDDDYTVRRLSLDEDAETPAMTPAEAIEEITNGGYTNVAAISVDGNLDCQTFFDDHKDRYFGWRNRQGARTFLEYLESIQDAST
jgi:hypothetical protein